MTMQLGDWYLANGVNFKIVSGGVGSSTLRAEAQITPPYYLALNELVTRGAICIYQASDELSWPGGD